MFGKKNKQPDTLSRYTDPTGELPNRELRLAQWYLTHRDTLYKIVVGVLIVVCVITMGYSLFAWTVHLFLGAPEQTDNLRAQEQSFQNFVELQNAYRAVDPVFLSTEVFENSAGRYDFSTFVKNPNSDFIATITYRYTFNGGETEKKEDVLLPEEERPIIVFGAELDGFPSGARLAIDAIKWQRVDAHDIADPVAYIAERMRFPVSDFLFQEANGLNNVPTHQISFDVENASAYSYWQPVFYIEYLDGDAVTGVGYLTFEKFRSGDIHHAVLHSFAESFSVSDIRVYPVMNVFDSDVFMSPGA